MLSPAMTAPGRVRWTSLEVIVALELKRTRALSKSLIPSKPVSAQKYKDYGIRAVAPVEVGNRLRLW